MTDQEFRKLVARLEVECEISPPRYRLRVLALALLGYAVVLAALGLGLGLLVAGAAFLAEQRYFVGGKLALIGGVMTFLLVRALWVRLEGPPGKRLTGEQAPRLFRLIEKLRVKLQAPPIHEVMLNDEMNASIWQTPRLGMFGWHRNTLVIGLPLLQALSQKQFTAVLAHEYGHLSGAHGKLGAWLYRLRTTWDRVYQNFDDPDSPVDRGLQWFFRRYLPFFSAYSFVLARQQEYEADAIAARIAGAREAADALVSVRLKGRFIGERFWNRLWRDADNHPAPALMPHASMLTALKAGITADDESAWLKEAMAQRTDVDDTHPALRDRLEALGEPARIPPPASPSAAQALFEERLPQLVKHFDQDWWRQAQPAWRERHGDVQDARSTLAELGPDEGALAEQDRERYGLALLTLDEPDRALTVLRRVADSRDSPARATFIVGRMLLERDDESGIRYLEAAMDKDGECVFAANERAWEFYARRGDMEKAEYYRERLMALQQDEAD